MLSVCVRVHVAAFARSRSLYWWFVLKLKNKKIDLSIEASASLCQFLFSFFPLYFYSVFFLWCSMTPQTFMFISLITLFLGYCRVENQLERKSVWKLYTRASCDYTIMIIKSKSNMSSTNESWKRFYDRHTRFTHSFARSRTHTPAIDKHRKVKKNRQHIKSISVNSNSSKASERPFIVWINEGSLWCVVAVVAVSISPSVSWSSIGRMLQISYRQKLTQIV